MKKLWLDVETTGLDANTSGIIQLACIDEDSKRTFSINMKPFKGCVYDEGAEDIHGKSEKMIKKYTPEAEAIGKFIDFLGKSPQRSIAGYNSRFDMDFIIALFKRNGYNFWTYFNYYDVDVFALVKILDLGEDKNKKLGTVCNQMGVKLDNAHDAMADIKATRKLYKKIMKKHFK